MADSISQELQLTIDGQRTPAFLARPQTPGTYPGVVVIEEWWGLTDHVKEVCMRFARQGYVAIAPDLYHGEVARTPDDAMRLMSGLYDNRAVADMNAAVAHLRAQPDVRGDRIGCIGYCMGGRFSLLLACHNSSLAACAVYYGFFMNAAINQQQPAHPIDLVGNINCPVLGIYGEDDSSIAVGDVHKLEEALKKAGKTAEFKIYPGAPHAFFNDTNPDRYRPEAARDAWDRTLAFYQRYLKA